MKRLIRHHWPWLAAGICAIPIAVVGYLFATDSRKARQIREKLQRHLRAKRASDDGMLIAKLNGQTHHLGRLERFAPVTFGPDPTSTIRIAEKGISGRLYYKHGSLMIQNLGTKPIAVNSIPLGPKARQRLVPSAIVDLSESTRLSLSLQQHKAPMSAEKEVSHECATAVQQA